MGKRRRTKFGDSVRTIRDYYTQYYDRLAELAMVMFDWKNLPDTVDARFLELTLFTEGKAVFFRDEVMGELCLKCIANGPFDVYGIPINRRAFAINGYQKQLTRDDSVIIYNNYIRTNSMLDVRVFANRLAKLDQIIDVNANAQKTPVLITADEKQRLTLLNVYQQWDGNQPVIYGDPHLDTGSLTVLKTDAPYIADNLYTLKVQIWNEAMTYLGISNLNIQKKERLVSDEVVRSQGGTIASRYSRLESRRQAAEKINEMFGLNIEVDYREDFRQADFDIMASGESGSGEQIRTYDEIEKEKGGHSYGNRVR